MGLRLRHSYSSQLMIVFCLITMAVSITTMFFKLRIGLGYIKSRYDALQVLRKIMKVKVSDMCIGVDIIMFISSKSVKNVQILTSSQSYLLNRYVTILSTGDVRSIRALYLRPCTCSISFFWVYFFGNGYNQGVAGQ